MKVTLAQNEMILVCSLSELCKERAMARVEKTKDIDLNSAYENEVKTLVETLRNIMPPTLIKVRPFFEDVG